MVSSNLTAALFACWRLAGVSPTTIAPRLNMSLVAALSVSTAAAGAGVSLAAGLPSKLSRINTADRFCAVVMREVLSFAACRSLNACLSSLSLLIVAAMLMAVVQISSKYRSLIMTMIIEHSARCSISTWHKKAPSIKDEAIKQVGCQLIPSIIEIACCENCPFVRNSAHCSSSICVGCGTAKTVFRLSNFIASSSRSSIRRVKQP